MWTSLKGQGVVKGVLSCFDLDVDSAERVPVSRWSARSAARTNDLDGGGPRGSAHARWESESVSIGGGYVVVVQRLHSEAYGLGAGPNLRLPVIPSPRKRGHGAVRVQHAGSISTATAPRDRK